MTNDIITTPIQLGKALRERRRQIKLSQRDLALTAGVGERFVVDVEAGKPTSQIGRVLRVVQAVGLQLHLRSISMTVPRRGDKGTVGYDIQNEDS